MSWIRCHIHLPATAAFLFVAIPYSICLVAQFIYGWPDKPGYRKYAEALKPRRIYHLTIATLDLLKYFKYGRLYFQLKLWYNNDENHKLFKKGIVFGRRGNKLDFYYPPNMPNSEKAPAPVVVFIYGGAWGSGERSTYCLLARRMAEELNAAVVCPDYCTYPKGNVLGMVQDVADCLVWTQNNGEKFNFDKDNILLIGHSAGAHLCALTVLFLADSRDELFIESQQQRDVKSSVKGVIGLSGVYDIMDHYEHEKKRGIEYVSTMSRAMNGEENFAYYSPTHAIEKLSADGLKRVPRFALLHGTRDIVVPVQSSSRFSELLASRSVAATFYLLPEVNHNEMVTDLMLSERRFYHLIFSCIKNECRALLETRRCPIGSVSTACDASPHSFLQGVLQ